MQYVAMRLIVGVYFVRFITIIILLYQSHLAEGQTLNQSDALYNKLLTGYNKFLRPVLDQRQAVQVNISMLLGAINGFDEVAGELIISGALLVTWKDERMSWDPAANDEIFMMVFPQNEVWRPPVLIAKSSRKVIAFGHKQDDFIHITYMADGTAMWSPIAVMFISCSVDVTYFPFDIQTCELMLAPWGHPISQVYFIPGAETIDTSFYETNGEWIVKDTWSSHRDFNGIGTVSYFIKLERRPAFFVVNVILPILFLGLLNVLVFILPAESGERVSYAITVLLALAVFMTIVGDSMPKTSEPMSILSYYLMSTIIYSALITFSTIISLRFHKQRDDPVPCWLASLIRCLSCAARTNHIHPNMMSVSGIVQPDSDNGHQEKANIKKMAYSNCKTVSLDSASDKVDWKTTGSVMDRVFFVMFALWIVVSTVVILTILSTRGGSQ